MIDPALLVALIDFIDPSHLDLTRAICESLYYLSMDSNLHRFISHHGQEKLRHLLDRTDDPSIFCSIVHILTEFIQKNQSISNDLIVNMIGLLRRSSNAADFLRIIKSLDQLTKLPQTVELFRQENLYSDLLSYSRAEKNNEIQATLLSILEQCAKDQQSAE